MDLAASPDIPTTFAGRCVLITGATGFIGKVLVEKILRCCPDVKRLYLLVRPGRKGESIHKRLDTLTKSKLFERLRECQPEFQDKLVPVQADLLQPKLGLTNEDIATLQAQVSVVFHVAATVKFNEVLKLSLQLNVTAVRMLLELSRGMDLHAFIHVSTAYSNCTSKHIEEKVYTPAIDPYQLLNTVDWMTDEMVSDMTPYLLGDWPNTYTFTKALAETVLLKESVDMPVCIVRPSIVGASWRDPIPGWVDNLAGSAGLLVASHKGLITRVLANRDMGTDIAPVDLVVNTLIVSAWHTAVHKPSQITVVNLVTSPNAPLTWKELGIYSCPSTFAYTENHLVFEYFNLVGCKIPFMVYDLFVRLVGKRPRMVRMYDNIIKNMHTLQYFTCNEWVWSNNNYESLMEAVPEKNKEDFFMNARPLDWREYLQTYCKGIKQFVLKEHPDTPSGGVIRLRLVHWLINAAILTGLCRLLLGNSQMARNLWYILMQFVFRIIRFIKSPLSALKA